mgnify:CR=1 FL=1
MDGVRAEIAMALEYAGYAKDLEQAKRLTQGGLADMARSADTLKTVFASLGAALSVGAFASMIKGTIDGVAALGQLSTKAGVSVEALSALAAVGKQSGTGADAIAASMNKLSKGMSSAAEDGKGVGQALKSLNIDFDQFARLSPDQQMLQVAKAMDGFADGGGKSAAAMALFGKQGAEMLPMLRDLAATGELQAKVTTEQANQARQFERDLVKLKTSGEGWKKELAMGMLPALSEVTRATLDVFNSTGGLRDQVKKLAADGTLAEWTRGAITGFTYLIDVGQALLSIFPMIGKVLAGVGAAAGSWFGGLIEAFDKLKAGDLTGAWEALKGGMRGVGAVAQEVGADLAAIWNQKLLGASIRDRMAEIQGFGKAAEATKPQVDMRGALEGNAKAASAAKTEYEKLMERIAQLTAQRQQEIEFGDKLTEGEKIAIEVKQKLAGAEQAAAAAAAARLVQLDKHVKAQQAEKTLQEQIEKDREQAIESLQKETKGYEDAAAEQAKKNTILAMGKEVYEAQEATRLRALALEKEMTAATSDQKDELLKQANALRERARLLDEHAMVKEAQDVAREWQKTADSIAQGLTDALMHGFGSAWSWIKQQVKAAVFKMTVQPVVQGAVNGLMGLGGGGSIMGDLSSLLSIGNSFSSGGLLGGAGAMLFGNSAAYGAALGTTSIGAGSQAAMLAAQTGDFGAAGLVATAEAAGSTLVSSLAAAAPYVAAVVALAAMLDKKATPHVGGYSLADAFGGVSDITAQQGGIRNATSQAATDELARAVAGALNSTASTFGQQAGYSIRSVFESDNTDPSWGLFHVLQNGAQQSGSFDALGTLNKDAAAGFQQYATLAAGGLRTALEALDLPAWASHVLEALGSSPGVENVVSAVQGINATQTAIVELQGAIKPLGGVFAQLSAFSSDAVYNLAQAVGGIDALNASLSAYYGNFYTEAERQAISAAQVATALQGIGVQVDPTIEALRALGRDGFRALVDAAVADGDTTALAALLKVQGAFADLVPAAVQAAQAVTQVATAAADTASVVVDAADTVSGGAQAARAGGGYSAAALQAAYASISEAEMQAATQRYLADRFKADGGVFDGFWGDWANNGTTQGALRADLAMWRLDQGRLAKADSMRQPGSAFAAPGGASDRVRGLADQQLQATLSLIKALDALESGLSSYLGGLSVGDLSALSPEAKYAQARATFDSLAAQSMAGDTAAAGALQQAADTLLRLSRDYNASGAGYSRDFGDVTSVLGQVVQRLDAIEVQARASVGVQQAGFTAANDNAEAANALSQRLARSAELERQGAQ